MEKKSTGRFIAALRKANGMTQKQLGEKLNVSDKAVSRWERDECAPDLSLIPVIAEIFQVTSDEILRGERINTENSSVSTDIKKTDKQIELILNDAKTKFSIRSIISLGIAFLGLLAAMLCNFGFNQAYIGFITACMLYLISLLSEAIFIKLAFSSVSTVDLECDKLNSCKRSLTDCAAWVYLIIIILFSVTLPLIVIAWEPYMGITAEDWFSRGLLYGIISAVTGVVFIWIVRQIAAKKGIYIFSEREAEKYSRINTIKKRCFTLLALILLMTFAAQSIFNSAVSASAFSEGRVFDNIEDFKKYIETPTERNYADEEQVNVIYYDENDNEISEYDAVTDFIYSSDGKRIEAEYIHRNENVVQIEYEWNNRNNITIITYTSADLRFGNKVLDIINVCWGLLYIIEIVAVGFFYNIQRKKVKPAKF